VVPIRPKSLQARDLTRYQSILRHEAERQAPDEPLAGEVYARVVWFHGYDLGPEMAVPDLDNLVKPILDALIGCALGDDRQVARCAVSRHDGRAYVFVAEENLPHHVFGRLSSEIRRSRDVLYIEIGPTAVIRAVLGPVDGVGP
jgi:Holliday junction resolvase RusA-like endonuclease